MAGKCLIISGGENCISLFDKLFFDGFDFTIACDKGLDYAAGAGIRPDLIMGDFDSVENVKPEDYPDIPVERFPCAKDDTDTMAAVKKALALGFKDIHIICALGNRWDHAFCNIQAGHYIAEAGGKVVIYGCKETVYIFKNSAVELKRGNGNSCDLHEGRYGFSVFALSDVCTGVSICGAEYSVENIIFRNSFPLGQSNNWALNNVRISVTDGVLMVVVCR